MRFYLIVAVAGIVGLLISGKIVAPDRVDRLTLVQKASAASER
jgi:hypothetical protein